LLDNKYIFSVRCQSKFSGGDDDGDNGGGMVAALMAAPLTVSLVATVRGGAGVALVEMVAQLF